MISGHPMNDVSKLEFDFVPQSDTLTFRYVFGSEEYEGYVCSDRNDAFGFFVSGPGLNGPYSNNAENIALIPGSTPPLGVAINTINIGSPSHNYFASGCESLAYSYLYVDNCGGGSFGTTIEYYGFTVVLTAFVVVQPCQTYHIKLSIGDAGDRLYDSGVFLEANSFSAAGLNIDTKYSASASSYGSVIEGCNDATVYFELVDVLTYDYPIAIGVGGTAVNGVDYQFIPDTIFIPAGQLIDSLQIIAYPDGNIEPTETIALGLDYESACASEQDTLRFNILDNSISFTGLDTLFCGTTSPVTLNGYPPEGVFSGPGVVGKYF